MAVPKATPPKKPQIYQPPDWLKGSTTVGGNYTAWNNYGQGTPDFGVGAGPGTPYHEVQKKVSAPPKKPVTVPINKFPGSGDNVYGSVDPRIVAIRRRLGWG